MQRNQNKLSKSLELAKLLSVMTSDEKMETAKIIREADIARLMKNTTINRELKAVRSLHKGKIKRFLTALSRHDDAVVGVNALFEKWSEKLDDTARIQ